MKKRMKKAMAGMSQTAQAAGILNETLKATSPLAFSAPPRQSAALILQTHFLGQAQLTAEQLRDAGKMTSAMEGSYSKEDINTIVYAMVRALRKRFTREGYPFRLTL